MSPLPDSRMTELPALPWRRGVAWLLFLGPFFFLSYGMANNWAANHATPGIVVFEWEHHIPFWPWTIVPYWSIDLLYGLSFLLCRTPRAVDSHALRLLTVQLISVACFMLFPLTFSFDRPATDGVFGAMFDALAGFDKPFNQAPSLHIGLLVVLWVRFAAASQGVLRGLSHFWAALIALSVLTTYQHHFIDLPTGALVGFLAVWLWPDDGPSIFRQWRLSESIARCRLGAGYLLGMAICLSLATRGGAALWLLWPAISLGLVGLIYLGLGAAGFQKDQGGLGTATCWLLAPYLAGAWLNSRLWTWRHPAPSPIADDVWLGRMPNRREMNTRQFAGLCDVTAEMPAPRGPWVTLSLPWLDLVAPATEQLRGAAEHIEKLRASGKLLVSCALGYSRSATAVAAWLLHTRRAGSVDEAIELIRRQRPRIVLAEAHRSALAGLLTGNDLALSSKLGYAD